jgi:hypothetical protein
VRMLVSCRQKNRRYPRMPRRGCVTSSVVELAGTAESM